MHFGPKQSFSCFLFSLATVPSTIIPCSILESPPIPKYTPTFPPVHNRTPTYLRWITFILPCKDPLPAARSFDSFFSGIHPFPSTNSYQALFLRIWFAFHNFLGDVPLIFFLLTPFPCIVHRGCPLRYSFLRFILLLFPLNMRRCLPFPLLGMLKFLLTPQSQHPLTQIRRGPEDIFPPSTKLSSFSPQLEFLPTQIDTIVTPKRSRAAFFFPSPFLRATPPFPWEYLMFAYFFCSFFLFPLLILFTLLSLFFLFVFS